MKTNCLLIFFVFIIFHSYSFSQCNNWLKLPSQPSYIRIGDLKVPGNQITVEATFSRTAPWSGSDAYQGDLVSKHDNPNDCNYLLRPGSAEITTSDGYFKTPSICPIELNKTYHVAMVYDGNILKFYRNGFLMSQIAATGNLIQNNWATQIGIYFNQAYQENLIGYINEVRIWNIARSQNEIRTYMNQSLTSPTTQIGLLAYYIFDDLRNKQGNIAWNGTLGGSASINENNPKCNLIIDSCSNLQTNVQVGFTAPDTVCVNTSVNITNTSVGASSYYWNFCVADVNTPPTAVNLGNPGGFLSQPVFDDIAEDNGNYYAFVVNHVPGGITRLDFGNSLLNTPTAVFLGNISGVMNINYGSEGIQTIKANGKWYGVVVGGSPASGSTPKLITIYFGANLNNSAPTAASWGNIGNMLQPIDLHVFEENGIWYGFTVNAENNTITRFNFTSSFDNPPSAVNLGNIGGLNYPTGVYAINDNGFWRVFVGNAANSTITRLDFGNSLLNIPAGVNLGNPGNLLNTPRDITLLKFCGQTIGFVTNQSNSITRLNFNSLTSVPTATDIGNLGNLNFPHSLSKLFRVGNDIYSFITNVSNNTITRLKFTGCSSSSISSSTSQNPGSIIYNTPGVYNINLTVNDGLPTQAAFCKTVVVLAPPAHSPTQNIALCQQDSIKIGSVSGLTSYIWNTGAVSDSIYVKANGIYWLEANKYGCSNRDSFIVDLKPKPVIDLGNDTTICKGSSLILSTKPAGNYNYTWFPTSSLSDSTISDPVATPIVNTQYFVSASNSFNCITKDTINIAVQKIFFVKPEDKKICNGDTVQLISNNNYSHLWSPAASLSDASISNPFAFPNITTNYSVTITDSVCNHDTSFTVVVIVNLKPHIIAQKSNDINCSASSARLNAQGALSYSWLPASGLDNPFRSNPVSTAQTTTTYSVIGTNEFGCTNSDTVTVIVSYVGKLLALLPSAFTPNGDGKNDCFGIRKWGTLTNLEFSIFNRWGELIFFTKDTNQCWDGTYKGKLQPNGVFVYLVKANTPCGNVFLKGTVALIK